MGRMDDFGSSNVESASVGPSGRIEVSGLLGQLTCYFDKEGNRVATVGSLSSLMAHGLTWDGAGISLGDDRGCPILVKCDSCPREKVKDSVDCSDSASLEISGQALVRQAQLDQAIIDGLL